MGAPVKHAPDLGKIIVGLEDRDAVHLAVAPVYAGQKLSPGQDVGLDELCRAIVCDKPIGIVDPFLKSVVRKGERFFLMLYPNTITSLRHEWTHPAFVSDTRTIDLTASKQWLSDFADQVGIPYDGLLEIGREALDSGSSYVGDDSAQDRFNEVKAEFLRHSALVLGKDAPSDLTDVYFSCAC